MKILFFLTKLTSYTLIILVTSLLFTSTIFTTPYRSQVVLTGSMGSTIPQGSIIIEKKFNDYQKGDIITFKNNQSTVTHRIVEKLPTNNVIYYKTKGDANSNADLGPIEEKNILGKVLFQIPQVGRLLMVLRTWYGFLLFFIIPSVIAIVMELLEIKREVVKTFEKKYLQLYFFIFSLIILNLISSHSLFTYAGFSDTGFSLNNTFSTAVADISPPPEPSIPPNSTPTPTPVIEDIANHLVISEVQTNGATTSQDFVELYNPTANAINLNGWRIRKKTSGGTISTLITIGTGKIIPAHGFFLWANSQAGFDISQGADVSNTNTLADNNSIDLQDATSITVDQVGFGTGTNQFMEGSLFPTNPTANHSLERKAVSSSSNVSMTAGGADESRGNGYDTNNNATDFIIRAASTPQNSLSVAESL